MYRAIGNTKIIIKVSCIALASRQIDTHTHTKSSTHTHTHTQSLATTGKLKNTIKKHIFQHAYMHERQHYPICGMLCHIAMV